MTMNDDQFCPICRKPVAATSRYPRYICVSCSARAVSFDGRPLRFFNLSLSGGYGAEYADNDEPYNSHVCYIDGVECVADEAHMGGIVIQVTLR